MNAPPLESIVEAVLAWQHRQPLGERLTTRSVHSIGLVALPFVRSGDDVAPPAGLVERARRWLLRGGSSEAQPAFSERFIKGLAPRQVAAFALTHGAQSIEGVEDWPQRRIEVDDRAARAGGWPFERWLLSAAIEGRAGRQRVLIGLEPPFQVVGRRVLDRRRLLALGLLLLLAAAGVGWLVRGDSQATPAIPSVSVSGAVQAASAALPLVAGEPASAPSSSPPPATASATSSAPAFVPTTASSVPVPTAANPVPLSTASKSISSTPAPVIETPIPGLTGSGGPILDIRPRLGPVHRRAPPASSPPAAKPASEPAGSAVAPSTIRVDQPAANPAPEPARAAPQAGSTGPVVALVSPVFNKRGDAEAMLERMRTHLEQTGAPGLDGGVFEAKPGYRAAVWPFASREEAQLINATMVARGWRTRAMDF